MENNESDRFQWKLCLAPQIGFMLLCPSSEGVVEVFFEMSNLESLGLVFCLGQQVPEIQNILRPEIAEWLRKKAAAECAGDAQFLQAAGVVAE